MRKHLVSHEFDTHVSFRCGYSSEKFAGNWKNGEYDPCLRCLFSLREEVGDAEVLEMGLPIVDRIYREHQPEYCSRGMYLAIRPASAKVVS